MKRARVKDIPHLIRLAAERRAVDWEERQYDHSTGTSRPGRCRPKPAAWLVNCSAAWVHRLLLRGVWVVGLGPTKDPPRRPAWLPPPRPSAAQRLLTAEPALPEPPWLPLGDLEMEDIPF